MQGQCWTLPSMRNPTANSLSWQKCACAKHACPIFPRSSHTTLQPPTTTNPPVPPPPALQFGKWVTANATIGGKFVAATLEERNSFLNVRRP